MPVVDLQLQLALKKKSMGTPEWLVQKYFEQFEEHLVFYTDGSKDPKNGRTGMAVSIPQCNIKIKRTSHYLAVYTVELTAHCFSS